MAKQHWRGGALLAPVPPVLVSCGTAEKPNALTIGWSGIINTIPPKTYISVRPERFSYNLIKDSEEFVINLAPDNLVKAVDYCGCRTGAKEDKLAKCGLTVEPAVNLSAPAIAQCPINLECKVTDVIPLGTHHMFIADIVGVNVDESLLDKNGTIDKGEILFEGMDLAKFKTEREWAKIRGKKIAMVMQDPMTSLNPLKTIGWQISEALILNRGMNHAQAKAETLNILKDVGISEPERRYKQYPHEFSGGMRQRVVIAIAVACSPEILICDEPTTALDVTIQAQILSLIKDLCRKYGMTTIYITHDLGVVANVADRIAVMYAGDIVEVGTSEEVFFDPKHPYTWALMSSLPQLGEKGHELYSIKGTPPKLFGVIRGDAFAPRNPQALKIDFQHRPPYFEVSPTHKARTWLLDPRAPHVEPPASIKNIRNMRNLRSNGGKNNG